MDYLNNMNFQQQIDFFFPEDVKDLLYSLKQDVDLILDMALVVNCSASCDCGRTFVPLEPFVNSFKNYYDDYRKLYMLLESNPYVSSSELHCGFCQYEIDKRKMLKL